MNDRVVSSSFLTLKHAIDRHPLVVSPETSAAEVLSRMSRVQISRGNASEFASNITSDANSFPSGSHRLGHQPSCTLVMEAGVLLGIVTERDWVKLAALGGPLDGVTVGEIMTSPVVTLRQTEHPDLFIAIDTLRQHQIRHLPVLDEHNQLVGVITQESLRQDLTIVHLLKQRQVWEVMTTDVIHAAPTVSVQHIAHLMNHHRISCVVITEPKSFLPSGSPLTPLGIITERDIVQFQALNLNLTTLQAGAVMSAPLRCLSPEDSLWSAHQQLQQHQIRRAVITGAQGELVGIITQSSILRSIIPVDLRELVASLQQRLDDKTVLLQEEIEQRHQLIQSLQESESKFQRLVANVPGMVYRFVPCAGGTDRFAFISSGIRDLFGIEREVALQDATVLWELIHPDDRESFFSSVATAIEAAANWVWEGRILIPPGQLKWIQGKSRAVEAEAGVMVWDGIFTDITDRKHAEQALRDSEARLHKIVAEAPIGMALITLEGQFLQANQTLCQILNYSETELQTRSIQDIIHPEDLERQRSLHQQLFNREIPQYTLEKRFLTASGDSIWVSITAVLLQDLNSGVLYKLAMVENITERRTIEQMKEHFVSMVSHELRTPITSIRGSLGLLAAGQICTLTPEGQEVLTIAISEVQRLERIIGDILDLERFKSGHITLITEACQVSDLIARSVDSVRSLARDASISIEVSADSQMVWADGDRIIQTLTNLLDNAIKFSANGSKISVMARRITEPTDLGDKSLRHHLPVVLFEVKDQGQGIPSNKLKAIFEPFEQLTSTNFRQKGGSGLGLAICQSIVERHGGQIWANSIVGQGSSFFFTLPCHMKSG